MNLDTINILLVEDSLGDIRLTQEAFLEAKVRNKLNVCKDGVEAMAFLHKEREYADSPTPDLILLDLNMPRKNGMEVLQEIKADDELKTIPIVILTTSSADADIAKSYGLSANCYISKPVDFEQFVKVIQSIEDFWLTVVKLPKTG